MLPGQFIGVGVPYGGPIYEQVLELIRWSLAIGVVKTFLYKSPNLNNGRFHDKINDRLSRTQQIDTLNLRLECLPALRALRRYLVGHIYFPVEILLYGDKLF